MTLKEWQNLKPGDIIEVTDNMRIGGQYFATGDSFKFIEVNDQGIYKFKPIKSIHFIHTVGLSMFTAYKKHKKRSRIQLIMED